MADSPSKRARERRKLLKRREKAARKDSRPPEEASQEAQAARYLDQPDEDERDAKD